jgi:hypothetical protein
MELMNVMGDAVTDDSKEQDSIELPLNHMEKGSTSSSVVAKYAEGEGLDLHFSRVEKSVIVAKGGGGLLSTDTKNAGETKKILKNVSGEAKAGEVLAIMVISGNRS